MLNPNKNILFAVLFVMGSGVASYAAAATTQADPARWSNEDLTPQARYQTAKKEAEAGYRENTAQCKSVSSAERRTCSRDARTNFEQEMKDAKKLLRR